VHATPRYASYNLSAGLHVFLGIAVQTFRTREHKINLDADLLLILRNSAPDLSAFFHHALRVLATFDLGLLAIPIREP